MYGRTNQARQLIEAGRFDELRELALSGYFPAQVMHLRLRSLLRDEDEIRRYAAGDRFDQLTADAKQTLCGLFAEQGRFDELRAVISSGYGHAKPLLAKELAKRGLVDELMEIADDDNPWAQSELAHLLFRLERIDDLRRRTDRYALTILKELDAGYVRRPDRPAPEYDVAGMRERAEADLPDARRDFIWTLGLLHRVDEARALADEWGGAAAKIFIEVLERHELFVEIADRVRAGDPEASRVLGELVDPPDSRDSQDWLRPDRHPFD